MSRTYSLVRWHGDGTPRETLASNLSVSAALERWSLEIFHGANPDHLYAEQIGPRGRKQFLGYRALQNYADQDATSGINDVMRGSKQDTPPADDTKLASYLQQENSVLHEKVRKLEIALEAEREACAQIAFNYGTTEDAKQCAEWFGGEAAFVVCGQSIAELIRRRR